MAPSDALLRTLAAVPPGARVVDAASGAGRHLVPLAQLGFDVHGFAVDPTPARAALAEVLGEEEAAARVRRAAPDALDLADASADWVVVADVENLKAALVEAARVLKPGAWVWAEADGPDALAEAARAAGLLEAQEPAEADGRAHAVYRKAGGVG